VEPTRYKKIAGVSIREPAVRLEGESNKGGRAMQYMLLIYQKDADVKALSEKEKGAFTRST